VNVVLGVSGSISAYRAADLARDLMRAGFTVRVCLTDAAEKFVTPILFETLTGQPCLQDTFEEPIRGRMAHIDWARNADVIVVAPATANTLSKLAYGIGDDMLTTLVLASNAPIVLAPAMNPQMFASDTNADALQKLSARAAVIVQPQEGDVACGEHGQGKLATNGAIVSAVLEVTRRSKLLVGQNVLITSGPTQEPIDDVRHLTNRSSGKMGAALARAVLLLGGTVTVVSGPVSVAYPLNAEVIRVQTALEMLAAARLVAVSADFVIGAAAVADYRPAVRHSGKLRRSGESLSLELMPNPDIVATLSSEFPEKPIIGFAAEPDSGLDSAREKLVRKGLVGIAVNDVSDSEIGFDSDQNLLRWVSSSGDVRESGLRSKLGCALWLLEQISAVNAS
jgi:phosphopantothenoylcysteine decarboxylase / phosphopantothenate---cysteine ligase